MGERKGTNKYYPPDYDPRAGGLNKFLGTHALRERARKIHMGIIIIRFEMPYNIWCEGCNNHIGMGVRYNAEKTKVGMYYTTPVYQFKMKCHLCDNHFVMKTDPGNLDYIILSGARRQENRWDPTKNEQVVPETKETQKRLFDDSMFKLEHGSQDQTAAESAKPRLVALFDRNESMWSDHYTMNQKLRENFRKRNLVLDKSADSDNMLLKKSSLDIPLLAERDEDKKYASLLSKVPCRSSVENNELLRKRIITSSALPSSNLTLARERRALKIMSSQRNLGVMKKNRKEITETVVNDKSQSETEIYGRQKEQLLGTEKNYDTSNKISSKFHQTKECTQKEETNGELIKNKIEELQEFTEKEETNGELIKNKIEELQEFTEKKETNSELIKNKIEELQEEKIDENSRKETIENCCHSEQKTDRTNEKISDAVADNYKFEKVEHNEMKEDPCEVDKNRMSSGIFLLARNYGSSSSDSE